MTPEELMALQQSNQAPFNHRDYTVWLHNQIIEKVRYEIFKMASSKDDIAMHAILNLPSLKLIK